MLLVAKPPLKVALSNPKALLPASHRDRALLDAMSSIATKRRLFRRPRGSRKMCLQ